ncbi:MAG: hypothetical protein KIT80_02980 [Chitinophagaceae bacterium]|nr:hypothetical protein [Chitinophagaceae bacterium]MCW5925849.1 hypothetical protein [Chitinophagaceae bacterium]
MKKLTNTLRVLLAVFVCQLMLAASCKKEKQDQDIIGLPSGDTKFDGVYIARDPRLNPSLPDHRYIEFDGWFGRRKNGHIFQDNTLSLIVSGAKGKVNIKTDFLPPGSSIPGLSSSQHARLLYVEVDNRKIYFRYYTQDQSHRALHADNVQGNSVEPWRQKENHWIIHDFSTNNDFKHVSIESAFERGWYIMNEATLNGDTRIRLMQRNSPNQATKWEIYKP